jgi:hypothetical protein
VHSGLVLLHGQCIIVAAQSASLCELLYMIKEPCVYDNTIFIKENRIVQRFLRVTVEIVTIRE